MLIEISLGIVLGFVVAVLVQIWQMNQLQSEINANIQNQLNDMVRGQNSLLQENMKNTVREFCHDPQEFMYIQNAVRPLVKSCYHYIDYKINSTHAAQQPSPLSPREQKQSNSIDRLQQDLTMPALETPRPDDMLGYPRLHASTSSSSLPIESQSDLVSIVSALASIPDTDNPSSTSNDTENPDIPDAPRLVVRRVWRVSNNDQPV
jgi:hypothetical protein